MLKLQNLCECDLPKLKWSQQCCLKCFLKCVQMSFGMNCLHLKSVALVFRRNTHSHARTHSERKKWFLVNSHYNIKVMASSDENISFLRVSQHISHTHIWAAHPQFTQFCITIFENCSANFSFSRCLKIIFLGKQTHTEHRVWCSKELISFGFVLMF